VPVRSLTHGPALLTGPVGPPLAPLRLSPRFGCAAASASASRWRGASRPC